MNGWIAVDLDGTLAEYHGWVGPEYIGAPIPKMVARVKQWIADGRDVRIFTARVDGGSVAADDPLCPPELVERFRQIPIVRAHIERWCAEHIGVVLPITNVKDYGMVELWDDRAVQVHANTGERADGKA